MTLDGGWALILATVIGVVLVWLGNLVSKYFSRAEESADSAHGKHGDLSKALAHLRQEFHQYQTHVAESYAKVASVERMEASIFATMARIEGKLDRLQERFSDKE